MRVMLVVLLMATTIVARGETLVAFMERRASEILARAIETGDLRSADAQVLVLRDQAIAYSPLKKLDAITVANRARQSVRYARLAGSSGVPVLRVFAQRPELAAHLLFAWESELDDEVLGAKLLLRLIEERPEAVDRFPALAAALVLVHDVPGGMTRRINENKAVAADPLVIFDHFVNNEKRLAISPRELPVELLVHVVDTTNSMEDLEWAVEKFGKRPEPGDRFFEIDYDYDSFYRGKTKKLTASGEFDIRAILEYGGVCADQAFYAEEVGKACGVPTAYVVARGAEVSHAWIGFLQLRGRRSSWNMDAGRYDAYKNLRGEVRPAGSGIVLSDAMLSLKAGLVGESEMDRWAAVSVSTAVVNWTYREHVETPERPEAQGALRQARSAENIEEMLRLLRAGIERAPYVSNGWITAGNLGRDEHLTSSQLNEWGRALDRLCGKEYADFSVMILQSMIDGLDTPAEQIRLWEWVHQRFGKRPDIAATIRLRQASLAIEMGDEKSAWKALMEVIDRYGGKTQEVVLAAVMAEEMLLKNGKAREVPAMLRRVWLKIPMPEMMAGVFRRQSNWYKVGMMYAKSLEGIDDGEAEKIRKRLSQ